MTANRIQQLRRALVLLCAISGAWALAITMSGGIVANLGFVEVTSRNPRNPLLVALLTGLGAWALPMPNRRQAYAEMWRTWSQRVREADRRWPIVRRIDLAAVVAVAGAGLLLSVWVKGRPLWLDEQMIAINVRDRSLSDLASGPLWMGQSAPFGWLAAERAAVVGFGTGEVSLRLPPVLFGCASMIAVVWVARRWLAPLGGLLFALLMAFSLWPTHYALEVKHYSADVFWGLLLPALAAWAVESAPSSRRRRIAVWWGAAAAGQWFANGAILVMPACALVIGGFEWRQSGWRAAVRAMLGGLVWLVSFALHYFVSVRYTLGSEYLRNYWHWGLPPPSAGVLETAGWVVSQLAPLAANPASAEIWWSLWLTAAAGFAMAGGPLGSVLALVPLSAFVFGALSIVPLADRLSLWIVPSLYLGVALAGDAAVRHAVRAFSDLGRVRFVAAIALLFLCLWVTGDIVQRGRLEFQIGRAPDTNHGLHDRAAVDWLMKRRQPGDAVLTTHLGLPAYWWYAPVPLKAAEAGAGHDEGPPMFEVDYAHPGGECAANPLETLLRGQRRVLVYVGFPDYPKGFDELLFRTLAQLGAITSYQRFSDLGLAAVVDLGLPPDGVVPPPIRPEHERAADGPPLDGCAIGRQGRKWF